MHTCRRWVECRRRRRLRSISAVGIEFIRQPAVCRRSAAELCSREQHHFRDQLPSRNQKPEKQPRALKDAARAAIAAGGGVSTPAGALFPPSNLRAPEDAAAQHTCRTAHAAGVPSDARGGSTCELLSAPPLLPSCMRAPQGGAAEVLEDPYVKSLLLKW